MFSSDDLLYILRVDAPRRRRRAHPHSHILGGLPPYPHPRWLCRRTLPAASRALCTLGDSGKAILCVAKEWTPIAFHRSPKGCAQPRSLRERLALPVGSQIFTSRDKGGFCNKSVAYLQYIRTAYLHVSVVYHMYLQRISTVISSLVS